MSSSLRTRCLSSCSSWQCAARLSSGCVVRCQQLLWAQLTRCRYVLQAKQLAQKAKRNVKNAIHGRSTPKRTQLTDSPGSSGRPANGSANPSTTLQDNPLRVDRVEEWGGTPNSTRPPVPSSPRDSSRPNAVELTRYHSPPPSRSRSQRQLAKRRAPSQ